MYLCFSCDGGHIANFLGAQRVDHRALANIWITDEPDADLFLVSVQLFKERTCTICVGMKIPSDTRVTLLC